MKPGAAYYPLFFSLFPILVFYNHNIKEAHLSQLFYPLLPALVAAAGLWGGLFLWLRDRRKAALGAGLFILLFFSYGHLFSIVRVIGFAVGVRLERHFILLPLVFGVWGFLLYRIKKTVKTLEKITPILDMLALGLVVFNLLTIGLAELKKEPLPVPAGGSSIPAVTKRVDQSPPPDIYFIILDGYASLHTIKELYKYDNSAFAEELRGLGFYIAEESRTGYRMTEKCLASVLNMRTLKAKEDAHALVRENKVMETLEQKGYRLISFPVRAEDAPRRSHHLFDFSKQEKSAWIDDFYMTLMKTTMLQVLYDWYLTGKYYLYYSREKILFNFEKLEQAASMKGPKFIYAHFFSPHWPYVFDRDGEPVDTAHMFDLKDITYYREQYIYISRRVSALVKAILSRSSSPPVIIIQSDHGPRGYAPGEVGKLDVGDHWTRIFNALYLPGAGKDTPLLSPGVSPVDTFHIVFQLYFPPVGSPGKKNTLDGG